MRKAILIFCLMIFTFVNAGGNKGLISHWSFCKDNIKDNIVKDKVGNNNCEIKGLYSLGSYENQEFIITDYKTESLIISNDLSTSELPKKEFTAEAVVMYKNPIGYGGIIGAFQDNGDFEKGWILGYSGESYGIGLAAKGADDGDGKMTYLLSDEGLELERWYHVAATYDGEILSLYINGKLHSTTEEQNGEIDYPENAFFEIAAYHDDDEYNKFIGKLCDIKLYDIVLDESTVKKNADEFKSLLELKSEFNSGEPAFLVKPYLQFATQTGIKILWETNKKSSSKLLFGENDSLSGTIGIDGVRKMHEVELKNLKPETRYYYKVISETEEGIKLESEISTFQTAVNDETAFAFLIYSDTQNNPAIWGKLAQYGWEERASFAIHTGDIVGTGQNKIEWLYEFLVPGNVLMSRIPIYTAIGNHENDSKYYYQYMANPEPEYHYTFTYGNAQFFMLDSNRPLEKGSDQYNWLESELKKSTAAWKFVGHHHPPYTSDENDYGDTYKGPALEGDPKVQDLIPLYEKYAVDIVFYGHIHDYERTWPIKNGMTVKEGGVIYVQTGGAGGGLENYAPTRSWFTAKVRRDHHYCLVKINHNVLQFEAIDQHRQLFDQFEIRK
ncbi:MAG: metallophosphoesterase [Ignavibacteria bacterium]|jgi:predicted phosphodiesterase